MALLSQGNALRLQLRPHSMQMLARLLAVPPHLLQGLQPRAMLLLSMSHLALLDNHKWLTPILPGQVAGIL